MFRYILSKRMAKLNTGSSGASSLKIAGNMTPGDRKILNDHVNTLKQNNTNPNTLKREIDRMNKMYSKYGMSWEA